MRVRPGLSRILAASREFFRGGLFRPDECKRPIWGPCRGTRGAESFPAEEFPHDSIELPVFLELGIVPAIVNQHEPGMRDFLQRFARV